MKKFKEIELAINKHKPFMAEEFKVKSMEIFGSFARGEQTEQSDLDILVEFYETIDLFAFIRLENFLSSAVGIKIDLITKDALKPRIKDRILQEAIPV
ncbi:nucleotidyltransferase family protein [Candidatus Saganbacteria bacterium]|nr:nucleotidyltransferase family protein [Candidatus Saganbacteria bacterium]